MKLIHHETYRGYTPSKNVQKEIERRQFTLALSLLPTPHQLILLAQDLAKDDQHIDWVLKVGYAIPAPGEDFCKKTGLAIALCAGSQRFMSKGQSFWVENRYQYQTVKIVSVSFSSGKVTLRVATNAGRFDIQYHKGNPRFYSGPFAREALDAFADARHPSPWSSK